MVPGGRATAAAIAREIGILKTDDQTLTGVTLAQLSEEAFLEQVENTTVYARVSPDQKLRIVKALQAKGHSLSGPSILVNSNPTPTSLILSFAIEF